MSKLYCQYMKERQDADVIEFDHSFAFYRVVGQELFICDMFIEREKRGSGALKKLIDALNAKANEHNCVVISGNIHLNDPNANSTLRAALAIGFKIQAARNDVLAIAREVKE